MQVWRSKLEPTGVRARRLECRQCPNELHASAVVQNDTLGIHDLTVGQGIGIGIGDSVVDNMLAVVAHAEARQALYYGIHTSWRQAASVRSVMLIVNKHQNCC